METENHIELRDRDIFPDDDVLSSTLGNSFPTYCRLVELFRELGLNQEWRYYNDGKAWLCKVQKQKRTIAWMSAWKGYAQATVYFPERSIHLIEAAPIPQSEKQRLLSAKPIGKSHPCTFEIRTDEVLRDIAALLKAKIANK